jgi:hypothetical protein
MEVDKCVCEVVCCSFGSHSLYVKKMSVSLCCECYVGRIRYTNKTKWTYLQGPSAAKCFSLHSVTDTWALVSTKTC